MSFVEKQSVVVCVFRVVFGEICGVGGFEEVGGVGEFFEIEGGR